MKYYIIAGEASGDLHGSNLMKGIYAEDPQAEIRFWGGDLMAEVWGSLECPPAGSRCGITDNPSHSRAAGPSPCGQGGSTVFKYGSRRYMNFQEIILRRGSGAALE